MEDKDTGLHVAEGVISIGGDELTEEQQNVLEQVDRESKTRKFLGVLQKVFLAACFLIALYHLYTAAFGPPLTLKHRSLHVAMMLALAFALYPIGKVKNMKKIPWYDWILIALAFAAPLYIWTNYMGVVERAGNANLMDTIMATILILLVLESSRRISGWVLPTLAILFLLYGLFGRYIPGMFRHRGYVWKDLVNHLFANTEGIYGTSVNVASSYIILFIIFGSVMSKCGMGQFFNDLALALAGASKGGPAKVSVVASGLLGSINGSAVANVVTTGTFTIPLMKKTGYTKEFSGAVEATASVGGQILPPVMGAAAFIMAELMGVRYSIIALSGAIPALLYYLGIMLQVHQEACKLGLKGISKENLPAVGQLMKERGYLILPILLLICMLFFSGKTVIFSAFFTILCTLGLHFVSCLVRTLKNKGSLWGWFKQMCSDFFNAMVEGVRNTVSVAVACACVGIVVGVISKTGMGLNMAAAIIKIGDRSLLLTLFFTMITCVILGMGVPSIPAYLITASIAAPALQQLGVPELAAHFFVFYFAMFANLTPPVALAAFAAAGLSGGDPMKTGFTAVKLALTGFLIPFMFVYCPQLLLIDVGLAEGLWVSFAAVVGVFMLAISIEGYWLRPMPVWLRIPCFIGALFLIHSDWKTDIVGFAVLAVVVLFTVLMHRKEKKAVAAA